MTMEEKERLEKLLRDISYPLSTWREPPGDPLKEDRRSKALLQIQAAIRAYNEPVKTRVKVSLFKPDGKYYTEEEWRIPFGAIGPADMQRSPDFRRISRGPVLVEAQEPWGYPFLFPEVK